MNGNVKWFNNAKGYGFIRGEDGEEVFVHYSAIKSDGFRSLSAGQEVAYEVKETPKGFQADNVTADGVASDRAADKDVAAANMVAGEVEPG